MRQRWILAQLVTVVGCGHTTASCSFSSSRCISAAVRGRGCRTGTGGSSDGCAGGLLDGTVMSEVRLETGEGGTLKELEPDVDILGRARRGD